MLVLIGVTTRGDITATQPKAQQYHSVIVVAAPWWLRAL